MSITRIDKSTTEAQLAVKIAKSDYDQRLRSELRKYQQQSHMKGFRKGKVPLSVIKKMYGKAVLADVVNELVQQKLGAYFQEEKLDILGQPLPSAEQEEQDFQLGDLSDFEFKFDIGLSPTFELEGVDDTSTFDVYKVQVSDEMIDEDMDAARLRVGKQVFPEDDIQLDDSVRFVAKELENGEVKPKGLETTFKILVSSLPEGEVRDQILAAKKGDTIRFDIFTLEGEKEDSYVRKYLLNLEEDEMDREVGRWYEGTINEVTRVELADIDQAFFDQAFGEGQVSSEDEAREKIKEHIGQYYDRQAEALLFRDFQDRLLAKNSLALPGDFLKRWLVASNEELDVEQAEREYETFAKNLSWTLIEQKIQQKFELQVELDEIKSHFEHQLLHYLGGQDMPEGVMERYVNQMLSDEEQVNKVYEEKLSDKIFEQIRDVVTLVEEPIDPDDFNKLLEEARRSRNASGADEEE